MPSDPLRPLGILACHVKCVTCADICVTRGVASENGRALFYLMRLSGPPCVVFITTAWIMAQWFSSIALPDASQVPEGSLATLASSQGGRAGGQGRPNRSHAGLLYEIGGGSMTLRKGDIHITLYNTWAVFCIRLRVTVVTSTSHPLTPYPKR